MAIIETQIQLTPADYNDLKTALKLLESPTITARISNLIGTPLELAVKKLPDKASEAINATVNLALNKAVDAALWSMENQPNKKASPKLHKLYTGFTGALGGAFGFSAVLVELPITTTIMMRAVADMARAQGFSLDDYTTKKMCVEVFAYGGRTAKDDATDSGYYAFRYFLNQTMNVLSKEMAEVAARQTAREGGKLVSAGFAPSPAQTGAWLAKLIEKIAVRYKITVTSKIAAQIVPVIGAVTGASINAMFTDYYQDVARGHFIVKRLELKYGPTVVESEYKKLLVN